MMREEISADQAERLVSQIVGQYVWSVRIGEDRVLMMEFGDPYLVVHPIQGGKPGSAFFHPRRFVGPSGAWSLFVEDGSWSIQAGGLVCRRDEGSETDKACLAALSGQRVEKVQISPDTMAARVEFDLGGVLDIVFVTDFEENSSWIMFCAEGWNVSHSSQNSFDVERI